MTDPSQTRSGGLSRRSISLRSAGCAAGAVVSLLPVGQAAAKWRRPGLLIRPRQRAISSAAIARYFSRRAPAPWSMADQPLGMVQILVKKAG